MKIPAGTKTMRVLSLDGGGVRGLSSSIVLKHLLDLVNARLSATMKHHEELSPAEIFDHIVGTSTGGLIGMMLVKLNLSIRECINVYKELCPRIFSKRQRGSCMGGLIVPRYCSENFRQCLQEVVDKYGRLPNGETVKFMEDANVNDNKACCTVVCRELSSTGRRLANPAFICSHRCRKDNTHDLVSTCLATTAAPTFFSRVVIHGRTYIDGAFGHTNNPTRKAHFHFLSKVPEYKDCSVVWMNIGTGSPQPYDTSTYNSSRRLSIAGRTWKDRIIPNAVRQAHNLLIDLKAIATDSDRVEEEMEDIINCRSNHQHIVFSRVSANNGVAEIQLDDWRNMPKIEALTYAYLKNPEVVEKLENMADELAAATKQRILQKQEQEIFARHERDMARQKGRELIKDLEKRASMRSFSSMQSQWSTTSHLSPKAYDLPPLSESTEEKPYIEPLLTSLPSSRTSSLNSYSHASSRASTFSKTIPLTPLSLHNNSDQTTDEAEHQYLPRDPNRYPASVVHADSNSGTEDRLQIPPPKSKPESKSLLNLLLNMMAYAEGTAMIEGGGELR